MNSSAPHILIIGCGFGGLEAAKALKNAPVRITLMDRHNHHLFQPLLYQVATAGLAAPLISAPIRHVFRHQDNVTTLLAEVTHIDAKAKTVNYCASGAGAEQHMSFDHLIVAAGATHSYFGHDDWAQHAPGLKTLADAMELRKRILLAFEAAEAEEDPGKREALLTFVVIGAGPTGVEMAGTLAEIARHTLAGEFRRINPADARVLLLEGGTRVLQAMPQSLSDAALAQLRQLGVQVLLGARVTQINAQGVRFEAEQPLEGVEAWKVTEDPENSAKNADCQGKLCIVCYEINSKAVIWAAGVAASPLGAAVANSTGCTLDRAGRVEVASDLSVPGHDSISVIGDLAAAKSYGKAEPKAVPGVSPAAKQMGRLAAANILRRIAGQSTQAFRYMDYGNLATIGRNAAVVDLATPLRRLSAVRFSGKLAWLFWLVAHIYFLIGFRNRVVVLVDWASAYLSFSRNARVIAETTAKPQEFGISKWKDLN